MDEIDGELSRFDRVEDGSDSLQGGVGSRMMGSAIFLKNLFTQEKSSSPTPSPSKLTRIPRQSGMVLDPLGVVLSKRSRQEEDGVLEEGSERCRKRVAFSDNLTTAPPTTMKLLAWNCRGLGNRRAVQELVDIVQAQDPMIVFLSETWSSRERMLWVRDRIQFDGCFTVPTDGRGGGLEIGRAHV